MAKTLTRIMAAVLLTASAVLAQTSNDPFPTPIPQTEGVIRVSFVEFASVPDIAGVAPRMMLMANEPGTRRLFVNDMRGPLYSVSYDGRTVKEYLDINANMWGVKVNSQGRERGVQSFAFHPQFNQRGTPGFGKFYTILDTSNITPTADFKPGGGTHTDDDILLEWTAKNPAADTYDGEAPRELIRVEDPFANHNAGQLTFNPLATPKSVDYGLLYIGFADGGSAGDPLNNSQNLGSPFGKILRVDPLGSNSANGKYGIPADNPFAKDTDAATMGEIYAVGLRNPQRIFWDPRNGNMFVSNIGQNTVEALYLATKGANFGWNKWEGSFRYVGPAGVGLDNPRSDPKITYPIVEYAQLDPLFQPQSAMTGGYVYRQTAIRQLAGKLLFGDLPSGEIFYINADSLPKGGQDPMRRVMFNDNGATKTLLQLIKEKNVAQGKTPATRADVRFGLGPEGQIYILNKGDGMIRLLVPDRNDSQSAAVASR